jgi:hypothetical protein
MTASLEELEAKVAELTAALRDVERRLGEVERGPRSSPAARRLAAAAEPAVAASVAAVPSGAATATFVGRTLLVLAGAFVLRALTEHGTLAAPLGVAAGLAYAGTWIVLADLAGRRGAKWSAGFHGASAALIGFPLVFEATFRFRLLTPATASLLLAGLTAVALAVAARRRLEGLAWLVSLAGTATAVALALAPLEGRALLPTLYVVGLGVATLWLGYVLDWYGLRWPIAAAANLLVAIMAVRALSSTPAEGPAIAFFVQAVLLLAYLGSIAARTIVLGRKVVPFEVVQTAVALAVGLGGAAAVAAGSGSSAERVFGLVSVLAGAGSYLVAFELVEKRQKGPANYAFYTTVALVLLGAGGALLLGGGPSLSTTWALLAVGASFMAIRRGRKTLTAHAGAYAVAASAVSGLLGHSFETNFMSPSVPWSAATTVEVVTLSLLVATAWLLHRGPARSSWLERMPGFCVLAVVACGAAGLVVGWIVPALAGAPPHASAGAVATIRTAAWVTGALVLTWIGKREAWVEAGWLSYPALAAIGLKILLEDLQRSRPATLFLAFALYGAALILVARARRPREGSTTAV